MTYVDFVVQMIEANRAKTIATLERAEELGALAWRPGEGRAHCGWQFMHIAATEEIFALQRFHNRELQTPEIADAYKHGSTPTDTVPPIEEIRDYLTASRVILVEAVQELDVDKLDLVPKTLKERGWSYKQALNLVAWHEGHHQGQAHITLNLFENQ